MSMFQLESSQANYRKNTKITIIDDYAFGGVLGEGSYGKVKEGIDTKTRNMVAIKIFSRTKLREVENGEIMVQREVSIMRSLHHGNIVNVKDDFIIEEKAKMYIVMEYVDGGTLQDLLDRAPGNKLPPCQAQDYLKEIIKGILYLQDNGVVHRDLKPDNILLTGSGHVKIGDFGSAVRVNPLNDIENCFFGEGSPAYQAPENLKSDGIWKRHPFKLDIWSAGIILYCMTMGKYPFENPNPITLFENIAKGVFKLPPDTHALLAELIRGMLEVNPEKRLTTKLVKKHSWLTTHQKEKKEVPIVTLSTAFDSKTVDRIMKSIETRERELEEKSSDSSVDKKDGQRCVIM